MSSHIITERSSATGAVAGTQTVGTLGGIGIAALRIALGFVFLWAFLDKTFGLGYSTTAEKSWISGGSPTNGFLSHVEVGPLQSVFNSIAGTWWANLLFMVGLLTVGVALIAGVALRLAAAAGSLMMVLMWAAEWPLARFTSTGASNGSSNPFVDYHLIYALSMIVLAVIGAGSYYGLAKWWSGITKDSAVLR
jgi:thiosulfate dehydrogenase [quinone] large subunit